MEATETAVEPTETAAPELPFDGDTSAAETAAPVETQGAEGVETAAPPADNPDYEADWDDEAKALYAELMGTVQPATDAPAQAAEQTPAVPEAQWIDSLFSPDPTQRAGFYQAIYEQSPPAFERLVDDIVGDAYTQARMLTQLGLDPEKIELYQQVTRGEIEPPAPAEPAVSPEFLQSLKAEYRELFATLPKKVQEDYALRDPEVANWDLSQVAKARAEEARQQQEKAAAEAERQQAWQAKIKETQTKTYQGARQAVVESLKKAFPGDDLLPDWIASAAETKYFDSTDGAAQWAEMAALIEAGDSREVAKRLTLMIATAKTYAAKPAAHLAAIYSDARKWREQHQKENPRREVARGDAPGTTRTAAQPGNGAGQYRPENIFGYFAEAGMGN